MASRCLALTAKACLWSYHRKAHQELLFVFVHAWSNAKTWSESFLVLADAGYLTPPHLRSQWVGALDMSQQFSVGMTTFLFLLSLCSTHIPPPTSLRLQVLNPHTPGSYQILWPPDGMHSHLLHLLSPAISSPPPSPERHMQQIPIYRHHPRRLVNASGQPYSITWKVLESHIHDWTAGNLHRPHLPNNLQNGLMPSKSFFKIILITKHFDDDFSGPLM